MIRILEKEKCTGCGACINVCPQKCISVTSDREGFLYPTVNEKSCVHCDLCNKTCPVVYQNNAEGFQKTYAGYSTDESIRIKSSSGGIFSELCKYIFCKRGGVVFGAAFTESHAVEHIYLEDYKDIDKLRMSKYVQSNAVASFPQAKEFLDEGRTVLFTGTPCQIAGLKRYLKKDYDSLYTQDIVCHGTPSPLVWDKYVKLKEKEEGSRLRTVQFRCKDNGWNEFSMKYRFENGEEELVNHNSDPYFGAFLNNLILRPSCYCCKFKNNHSVSDVTVGDFWGIENVIPGFSDNKGVSLIICNNEKGMNLFKNIQDSIVSAEVSFQSAVKSNSAAVKSVRLQASREAFFNYLRFHGVHKTLRLFCSEDSKSIKKVQMLVDYLQVKRDKGATFAYIWLLRQQMRF